MLCVGGGGGGDLDDLVNGLVLIDDNEDGCGREVFEEAEVLGMGLEPEVVEWEREWEDVVDMVLVFFFWDREERKR